jgi:hypothetical protein
MPQFAWSPRWQGRDRYGARSRPGPDAPSPWIRCLVFKRRT